MKRFLKRIVAMSIVSAIVLSDFGIAAFANSKKVQNKEKEMTPEFISIIEENEKTEDDISKEDETFEINEFQLISDLQNASDDELMKSGYTKEEIKEIKNIDYNEFLSDLKTEDKKSLKQKGYSDDRIAAIYAYDGSGISAMSASATLSVSYRVMTFSNPDGGKTYYTNRISWTWSEVPYFTFHDCVAASISEGMYRNDASYHKVKYYDMDGDYVETKYYDMDSNGEPTGLMGNVFDVNLKNSANDDIEIAMKGYAYFSWTKKSDVEEVSGYISYGHAVLSCVPDFSLTSSGLKLSITPTSKINKEYNKYYYTDIDDM